MNFLFVFKCDASHAKGPSEICGQCSFRSASPHIRAVWSESHTVGNYISQGIIDLSADKVALRSDCANARTDPELHCPHLPEGILSCDVPQMTLSLLLEPMQTTDLRM